MMKKFTHDIWFCLRYISNITAGDTGPLVDAALLRSSFIVMTASAIFRFGNIRIKGRHLKAQPNFTYMRTQHRILIRVYPERGSSKSLRAVCPLPSNSPFTNAQLDRIASATVCVSAQTQTCGSMLFNEIVVAWSSLSAAGILVSVAAGDGLSYAAVPTAWLTPSSAILAAQPVVTATGSAVMVLLSSAVGHSNQTDVVVLNEAVGGGWRIVATMDPSWRVNALGQVIFLLLF